jgi:phosphoribosyl 1,2-cyclic phosphate phosphodiesterase
MKAILLGTGTSVGIPVIGCDCRVCRSGDPRNKRRRTSLYLEAGGAHVVVDTPPDFREQMLAHDVRRLDAVLFTHSHADHVFGFDDIRRFNTIQDCVIPAYASPRTIADLRRIFNYIGTEKPLPGLYRPRIEFCEIGGPFSVAGLMVKPLEVVHGPATTLGFRFEAAGRAVAYVPDCYEMSDRVIAELGGLDVMILDGLRHRPHRTHLTVADSVELLERIGAKESYIVHMCHDLDHEETEKSLPEAIHVSYDGQVLEV